MCYFITGLLVVSAYGLGYFFGVKHRNIKMINDLKRINQEIASRFGIKS